MLSTALLTVGMAGYGSCHPHPANIWDINVKIQSRYFPIIILATFILFVLLGLALGFRPQHGDGGGPRAMLDWLRCVQVGMEGIL